MLTHTPAHTGMNLRTHPAIPVSQGIFPRMREWTPFSAFGNGSGSNWDGLSGQSTFSDEADIILKAGRCFDNEGWKNTNSSKIYIDLEVADSQNKGGRLWRKRISAVMIAKYGATTPKLRAMQRLYFTTIEEYQNVLARYTLICMMTQNPMTLYSKEFRASIINVASIPRAYGDEPKGVIIMESNSKLRLYLVCWWHFPSHFLDRRIWNWHHTRLSCDFPFRILLTSNTSFTTLFLSF